MDLQSELLGFLGKNALELAVMRVSHVGEAQTETCVVRSAKRIRALHVDVVANRYQAALAIVSVDSAGRVREDHGSDAHARKHTHRKRDLLHRIPFIQMNASLHAGYRDISHVSYDEPAGMPDSRRAWKVGNLCIGNFR